VDITVIHFPPSFHQSKICPVVKQHIDSAIPEHSDFHWRYSRIQEFYQAIPKDQRDEFENSIKFDYSDDKHKIISLTSDLFVDNEKKFNTDGILQQLKVEYPKAFDYHCAQVLKAQKQEETDNYITQLTEGLLEVGKTCAYIAPAIGEMLVSVAMIGGIVWGGSYVTSPLWGRFDNKLELEGFWSSYDSTQALFGEARPFQMNKQRDGSVDIITSASTNFDSIELKVKYISGPDTSIITIPRNKFNTTNGGIIYNLNANKDAFQKLALVKVNK
jgi:hypothetical protein